MTALYIVLALVLLCALVLSLRLKLYIRLNDGFTVQWGIGLFRKTVVPEKKKNRKKPRLSSFTYRKHEKRLKKEREKSAKKAKKRAEKDEQRKKRSKIVEKASETAAGMKKLIPARIRSVVELLRYIIYEIPYLASHMHTDVRRAVISIGSADAATTAELYGGASAAVSLLIELLSEKTRLKPIREGAVSVRADFLSEKTTAELDIVLKLSVFSALRVGLKMLWQMAMKKSKQALQKINQ